MDAKSFKKEEERPTNTHINFLLFMFHNLGSGIVHNPAQKWYYYSHQKSTEVLVFHQYSKVKNKRGTQIDFFSGRLITKYFSSEK